MARTLTRRQAVSGGALGVMAAVAGGAGLVQAGVLPGRYRVARLLGACGQGELPATTVAPGPLRFASFPPPGAGGGRSATASPGRPGRSPWPRAATTAGSGSARPPAQLRFLSEAGR
jgi:hypothetical protein